MRTNNSQYTKPVNLRVILKSYRETLREGKMDFNTTVQNNERDQQVTSFTRGNITMKLLPNFYSLVLQCSEINWLQGRNIKFSLENHRN